MFLLIESLREPHSEYTITEFSRKLNLSVGSVQRITNTLISLGYLVKSKRTKKYRLTPKWLPVGFGVLAALEIRRIALPHLKQLYKDSEGTACLALRDGDEVIYIERLLTPHLIGFNIRPGLRRPLYPNSMGKAILAFLPDDQQIEVLNRILSEYTFANKSFDKAKIIKELNQTKQRGFAINRVQYSGGALAIAAPVFNHQGKVIGLEIENASETFKIPKKWLSDLKRIKLATIMREGYYGFVFSAVANTKPINYQVAAPLGRKQRIAVKH